MWVEEASTVDISNITRFFTNQQYDRESGLYYYNARYYDPHLGSFITPDPAMDGLNHYAYANSNPIKYSDPTGLYTDYSDPSSPPTHHSSALPSSPNPPGNNNTGGGGGSDGGSNETRKQKAEQKYQNWLDKWVTNKSNIAKSHWQSHWDNKWQDKLGYRPYGTTKSFSVDFSGLTASLIDRFVTNPPKNKGQGFGKGGYTPPYGAAPSGKTEELEKWTAREIATYFDFQARNVDGGGNLRFGVANVTFTNGIITFEKDFIISSNRSWGFGFNLGFSQTSTKYTAYLPGGSTPDYVIKSFTGYFDSGGISFPVGLGVGGEVSYTQGEDGVWSGITYGGSISPPWSFSLSEIHTFYQPTDKPYILK